MEKVTNIETNMVTINNEANDISDTITREEQQLEGDIQKHV